MCAFPFHYFDCRSLSHLHSPTLPLSLSLSLCVSVSHASFSLIVPWDTSRHGYHVTAVGGEVIVQTNDSLEDSIIRHSDTADLPNKPANIYIPHTHISCKQHIHICSVSWWWDIRMPGFVTHASHTNILTHYYNLATFLSWDLYASMQTFVITAFQL